MLLEMHVLSGLVVREESVREPPVFRTPGISIFLFKNPKNSFQIDGLSARSSGGDLPIGLGSTRRSAKVSAKKAPSSVWRLLFDSGLQSLEPLPHRPSIGCHYQGISWCIRWSRNRAASVTLRCRAIHWPRTTSSMLNCRQTAIPIVARLRMSQKRYALPRIHPLSLMKCSQR
jgi:hypothetical protein